VGSLTRRRTKPVAERLEQLAVRVEWELCRTALLAALPPTCTAAVSRVLREHEHELFQDAAVQALGTCPQAFLRALCRGMEQEIDTADEAPCTQAQFWRHSFPPVARAAALEAGISYEP
jgi:hypothetical protein